MSDRARHEELIADLERRLARVREGGGAEAMKRHRERGKLPARERIERLCDPGAPFLELAPLAAEEMYEGEAPSAGVVAGVGRIAGRRAMVVANDATVKGGTYFPMTVKKHLRAQAVALENRLPCVYLVDSGGAYLPLWEDVFPDSDDFGRIFFNQARLSELGVPQVASVMGSCTAGGAYVPAMCDESVIVREQGTIFLGGPPLVKAATGEEVTAEELGGGDVHARESGVVDHLATDDAHALEIVRRIASTFPAQSDPPWERREPRPPAGSAEELLDLVPIDSRTPYDVREVLTRIIDGGELDEFKATYGETLLCAFAHLDGHRVGVIANNGILFSESSLKGAHFIELCDRRGFPILFFQNIAGFMVGREYEAGGIAKDGAKLVTAVSGARVPKLTTIIGGSYGAGNYGMCGRAYGPRFLYMWPNARISVMGGEQAATVLATVRRERAEARGEEWPEAEEEEFKRELVEQYEAKGNPIYSTAHLWDDGVIDPRDTREVLAKSLAACAAAPLGELGYGVFRM